MKRLLILALWLLAPAAAMADPSNILVDYDGDTNRVVEIIVPDSDAQIQYFTLQAHPHPELANPQQVAIPYADAKLLGIIPAIRQDAPALIVDDPAGLTAPADGPGQ